MNCCDYNCNQGRECPARAGHVPPTAPACTLPLIPHVRGTCDALGVCQDYRPRCGICTPKVTPTESTAAANTDVNVVSGMDELCEPIFYWCLLLAMVACTVVVLGGAAGFLYVRFFA